MPILGLIFLMGNRVKEANVWNLPEFGVDVGRKHAITCKLMRQRYLEYSHSPILIRTNMSFCRGLELTLKPPNKPGVYGPRLYRKLNHRIGQSNIGTVPKMRRPKDQI